MDEGIGGDIDGAGEGEFAKDEGEGRSVGKEIAEEAEASSSSGKGENEGELTQADQNEKENESNSEQFDPNEPKSDDEQAEFNPNESGESEPQSEFNPNESDEISDHPQFDPNETKSGEEQTEFDPNVPDSESRPEQFNPNESEGIKSGEEQTEFDPNEHDEKLEPTQFDPNKEGEESQENVNSQLTSTVLLNENEKETQEGIQENDQDELEKEVEKELKEGVEAINKYLEEEAEFINAHQEILSAYEAEQLYESMKEEATTNEEISENSEELESEKEEVGQAEEAVEPQSKEEKSDQDNFEEEGEVGFEEVEQHQVESLIEEALETEPEPIVNEEEIERLQEMSIEEQFQTVRLKELVEELVENQEIEPVELNENEEKEEKEESEIKADPKEESLELEKELEINLVEQHQLEPFIEETLETEPESIVNEAEIEKLQEMDIEEQFETVRSNEYVEELVEWHEEDEEKSQEIEKVEQEKEISEQTEEEIQKSTYLQEKLDEQEWNLELDYEEREEVHQHQVEAAIEEELENESEPIVEEEKLEHIKNLEPEKQLEVELFYELIEELKEKEQKDKEESEEKEEQVELTKEEKIAQITRELEIIQVINSAKSEAEISSQELEKKQKNISVSADKEEEEEQSELVEVKDPQQELEEILEQYRVIEQESFIEIERDLEEQESDKNEKDYERAKELYREQTGKRPIYANRETIGFKQWLEQHKESTETQNEKEEKKLIEEQKKEETWKWSLYNWIESASEISTELRSILVKLVKEYEKLQKLVKRYSQLYNKAQREKLSQTEKNELKSLIKALQKIDPINIELFLGIREIKRYLEEQYYNYDFWDKPYVSRVQHHFFTRLSQQYKSLKEAQKREMIEEKMKNWIENASEEEISPSLKALLKEIVENYSELEKMAIVFMKLYTKTQHEKLSRTEKNKLKSLIKTLQKLEPIKIELFARLRAIKNYLNDQNSDEFCEKTRVNRILSRFFVYSSQKYKNFKHDKQILLNNTINLSDLSNKIPYINIGKEVISLTPLEFKKTYRGLYSHYFRKVKDTHNRYLGVKTLSALITMLRRMNYFGVIYKITQVRDENWVKLNNGPVLALESKKVRKGYVRIGRTINFYKRLNEYKRESALSTRKKLHFENSLRKYGFKAFRIEILAVCKTEKELIITEYFWQLYFNRKANVKGYDLNINEKFNARLGSRGDSLSKYSMPKWEITKLILQNKNKKQILEFYANRYFVDHIDRSVLNSRLEKYFSGSHDLQKIKLELVKPLLEVSFRRGYTSSDCLDYLKHSGIEIYEKSYERKFHEDIYKIYQNEGIKFVSMTSAYQQVYLEKFVINYKDYLLSIGIGNRLESLIAQQSEILRDDSSGRYTNSKYDFTKEDYDSCGIIEYLLAKDVSTRYIAIALGLCKISDSDKIKDAARSRIEFYLKAKYKITLSEFSITNLVVFLRSHNLDLGLYKRFLNSL